MWPPAPHGPKYRAQTTTVKYLQTYAVIAFFASRQTSACQPQTTQTTYTAYIDGKDARYSKQFLDRNPGSITLSCCISKSTPDPWGYATFIWERKLSVGFKERISKHWANSSGDMQRDFLYSDDKDYSTSVDPDNFTNSFAIYRLVLHPHEGFIPWWLYGEYQCGVLKDKKYSMPAFVKVGWVVPTATCWQNSPSTLNYSDSYALLSCLPEGYELKDYTRIFWVPPSVLGEPLDVPSARGDFTAFAPTYGAYALAIRNVDDVKRLNRDYNFTVVEQVGPAVVTILSARITMGTKGYDVYVNEGSFAPSVRSWSQLLMSRAAPFAPSRIVSGVGGIAALLLLLLHFTFDSGRTVCV